MSRMRTWRITLDDGLFHAVEAHSFHEDGKFTVFAVPDQSPVFATLTDRIVSISREPDDAKTLHEAAMAAESDASAPAPTTITINMRGSVLSEQDLRDAVEKQMYELGQRRTQAYPTGYSRR